MSRGSGIIRILPRCASDYILPLPGIFFHYDSYLSGLASFCINSSDPPSTFVSTLLNIDHFSRPDDRGAVHNGYPHANVSPFPPFTFTQLAFAPSERE